MADHNDIFCYLVLLLQGTQHIGIEEQQCKDDDERDGRFLLVLNHGRVVKHVSCHLEVFEEGPLWGNQGETLNLNVHYNYYTAVINIQKNPGDIKIIDEGQLVKRMNKRL